MAIVWDAKQSITMRRCPSSDLSCGEPTCAGGTSRNLVSSLIISVLVHGLAFQLLATIDSYPGRSYAVPLRVHLASPRVGLVETDSVAVEPVPVLPAKKREADLTSSPSTVPSTQSVLAATTPAASKDLDRAAAIPVAAPVRSLPEPPITNTLEPSGNRVFLRQVDLDIQMFIGTERRDAGMLTHQFRMLDKELYGVTVAPSSAEGEPKASSAWRLRSSGSVRHQGLAPVMVDARGEVGMDMLMFDKAGSSGANAAGYSARVQDGILDRHSLLYQFMMQPPAADGGEIWMTDGISYQPYRYKREGEDRFRLEGVGIVRAARYMFYPTASGSPFELWLIPEMHYLPVKMRYQNAGGNSVELVVVRMHYD